MNTVGSLADLISGSDTPKKKAVKVKDGKYDKPMVAKPKVNKNTDLLTEKNKFKSPRNGKSKLNKDIKYNKFVKSSETLDEPQLNVSTEINEIVEQTSGAIIQNKKLNNAENKNRRKYIIRVHNLPKNIEPSNITELFKKCGNVLSVRISKTNPTFCYIHFENSLGVERAVNMKNPTLGRQILKIKEYQKKDGKYDKPMVAKPKVNKNTDLLTEKDKFKSPRNGKSKLNKDIKYNKFVKSSETLGEPQLNVSTEINEIVEQTSGAIIQNKKLNNAEKRAMLKRKAVDSEIPKKPKNPKDVSKVVENDSNNDERTIFVGNVPQLSNAKLDTGELRVTCFMNPEKKTKKQIALENKNRRKYMIRVHNLPKNIKPSNITELFEKCGNVQSVRICKTNPTFCYIHFENSLGVERAVNMKNPTLLRQRLKIKECQKVIRQQQHLAICVTNIPLNTKREEVRQLFEDCGNILSIKLIMQETRETGIGFINFENDSSVENALKKNATLRTRKLRISRK